CQDIERTQKRKAGIDQGGKLPGENHQDFRFHLLTLEKRDAGLALRRRDGGSGDASSARSFYFSIARCWRFPFFINAGWEISRLPQMPDGLIRRIGLDGAGRFLAASIEGDVLEAGHDRYLVNQRLSDGAIRAKNRKRVDS